MIGRVRRIVLTGERVPSVKTNARWRSWCAESRCRAAERIAERQVTDFAVGGSEIWDCVASSSVGVPVRSVRALHDVPPAGTRGLFDAWRVKWDTQSNPWRQPPDRIPGQNDRPERQARGRHIRSPWRQPWVHMNDQRKRPEADTVALRDVTRAYMAGAHDCVGLRPLFWIRILPGG